MKKGFTLVELLAVIAVIGVLALLLAPNIIKNFSNAKQKSFTNEVKEVYATAKNQYSLDKAFNRGVSAYAYVNGSSCSNKLDVEGRTEFNYYVEFDADGNVIKLYATDGEFQYSYEGSGLQKTKITEAVSTTDLESNQLINLTCNGVEEHFEYKYSYRANGVIGGELYEYYEFYDTPEEAMVRAGGDFCFRFKISNNIIREIDGGFKKNGNIYYIAPGAGENYNRNVEAAKSAFGESNCIYKVYNGSTGYECTDGAVNLYLYDFGDFQLGSSTWYCSLMADDGHGFCNDD